MRPRLVLLLDVSRSMSPYSFFYLRLARALSAELADVHCFHLSYAAHRDRRSAARSRSVAIAGTPAPAGRGLGRRHENRECVQDFNRRHAPRLVHSRTAVIIVSDGYDTGEPELLGAALGDLRRRARRIVWLNPLLDRPGFQPGEPRHAGRAATPRLLAPGADLAGIDASCPT